MSQKNAKKTPQKGAADVTQPAAGTKTAAGAKPRVASRPKTAAAKSGRAAARPARPPQPAPKAPRETPVKKPPVAAKAPGKTTPKKAAAAKPPRKTPAKKSPTAEKTSAPGAAKAVPAVHFSDEDLADFRERLVKLRNDLTEKVAYLHDSSLKRTDEVNIAEEGSDAFDRLFSLERASGVQQRIYAIDEALREIDDGTYGICQVCESLIRKQRLIALPFARNCIDCQEAAERKHGGKSATAPRRFVP